MLSREQFSGTKLEALAGLIGLSWNALSTNVKAWDALTTPEVVVSKPEPKIIAFLKHISEDYHFLVNSALPTLGIELLPFRACLFNTMT